MRVLGVYQSPGFYGEKIDLLLEGVDHVSETIKTDAVNFGERGEYEVTDGAGVLSIFLTSGLVFRPRCFGREGDQERRDLRSSHISGRTCFPQHCPTASTFWNRPIHLLCDV